MDLSRDNIQQLYGHLQILSMCQDISYLGMEVYVTPTSASVHTQNLSCWQGH